MIESESVRRPEVRRGLFEVGKGPVLVKELGVVFVGGELVIGDKADGCGRGFKYRAACELVGVAGCRARPRRFRFAGGRAGEARGVVESVRTCSGRAQSGSRTDGNGQGRHAWRCCGS
jgi:hypothetical protein